MKTLPRLVGAALADRLRVMPAVVVTIARQTGKSTLAESPVHAATPRSMIATRSMRPEEIRKCWSAVPGAITVDEVQRAPELLRAVKRAIDRDPKPGRFLLTGSANLLLMKQVSESLAGRASYLTL